MSPYGREVLVIGAIDHGEADRIIQVLSRRGRASFFAPAARKSQRRFAGALEPFTTIEIEIHAGRRAGLPTLTSASVTRSRVSIRAELERIALASYVAELSAAVAPDEDSADELYELAAAALDRIDDLETPVSLATRRSFEIRLLGVLGYEPNLERCAEANCALEETSYLDLSRGGAFCAAHRGPGRAIGPVTLAWLRQAKVGRGDPLDELAGQSSEAAIRASSKLGAPMEAFLSQLLGRPLRSSSLLATLSL